MAENLGDWENVELLLLVETLAFVHGLCQLGLEVSEKQKSLVKTGSDGARSRIIEFVLQSVDLLEAGFNSLLVSSYLFEELEYLHLGDLRVLLFQWSHSEMNLLGSFENGRPAIW